MILVKVQPTGVWVFRLARRNSALASYGAFVSGSAATRPLIYRKFRVGSAKRGGGGWKWLRACGLGRWGNFEFGEGRFGGTVGANHERHSAATPQPNRE